MGLIKEKSSTPFEPKRFCPCQRYEKENHILSIVSDIADSELSDK